MNEIVKDYIENYLRELLPAGNERLAALRRTAEENNIPIIHSEVEKHIELLITATKVQRILEIGTAVGYSASAFAHFMGEAGSVDTIERSFSMVVEAKENFRRMGLNERVNLLVGDAQEVIKELSEPYDMIFLDGAKGHYIHLLPDCLRLLKPGGLIVSDNVLFKGMIASNELVIRRKITIVKRMRRYLKEISNHPELLTSILPLGDGLAVSYKK
ncbi:O-methyltransferase [Eubacteriaceae bacterium ES3]|nr:O-methyltransferase [Eubacteriaceae bacterium ES3]